MAVKKIFILFSGNGSNFEAIVRALHKREFSGKSGGGLSVEVCGSLCNNPNAYGVSRAENLAIPCEVLNHRDFSSREDYDKALVAKIREYSPNLCVLAGFMRILTPIFTKNVQAINIHPSLLPLFKGANALKESYHSSMKVAGVSVHRVSEELDAGEIIAQECLPKIEGESLEDFEKRIHRLEHSLYPRVIIEVLQESL